MLSDIDRCVIESACRQIFGRYAVAVDSKNIDLLVGVFLPDGAWIRPGMNPMKGRLEIRTFFEAIFAKQRSISAHGHVTRHLFTTISIEPSPCGRRATGIAYAIVYRDAEFDNSPPSPLPLPELIAEYHDVFEKDDEGWRIAEHRAQHIFRASSYGQILTRSELEAIGLG